MNQIALPLIPLLFFPIILTIEQFASKELLEQLYNENDAIELLQVAVISIAMILAFIKIPKQTNGFYKLWVSVFFLGCVYIAGEELSWGQHFLNFETPSFWLNYNDQGETNLHNTSSWLDQKPRLVLEIGIILTAIFLSFIKFYNISVRGTVRKLLPNSAVITTAICFILLKVLNIAEDFFAFPMLFTRSSELEELYIYYFLLLYIFYFGAKNDHHFQRRVFKHQIRGV